MNFTRIETDINSIWVSGIYLIARWGSETYVPYYLKHGQSNWGDYVVDPPKRKNLSPGWNTLEEAQKVCEEHSRSYEPTQTQIVVAEINTRRFLREEKNLNMHHILERQTD